MAKDNGKLQAFGRLASMTVAMPTIAAFLAYLSAVAINTSVKERRENKCYAAIQKERIDKEAGKVFPKKFC